MQRIQKTNTTINRWSTQSTYSAYKKPKKNKSEARKTTSGPAGRHGGTKHTDTQALQAPRHSRHPGTQTQDTRHTDTQTHTCSWMNLLKRAMSRALNSTRIATSATFCSLDCISSTKASTPKVSNGLSPMSEASRL